MEKGNTDSGEKKELLLTASSRKEYQKLIERRQTTILSSLEGELVSNEDVLASRLRQEKGLELSTKQLEELISNLQSQIDDIVQENMPDMKRDLEVQISEVDDEYEEKIRRLKLELRAKIEAMDEARKEARQAKRDELKGLEAKIALTHAKDLVEKVNTYKIQCNRSIAIDVELRTEVQQRLNFIRQSKGRLISLIKDVAGRALEDIMSATTVSEAKLLLEKIPTVSIALEMLRSKDGMMKFFHALDPSIPLLSPPIVEESKGNGHLSNHSPLLVESDDEEERDIEGDLEDVFHSGRNRSPW